MTAENKPIPDVLEFIQTRYRSPKLRGSCRFAPIDPAPEGGPDYRLNFLREEDRRLRESFVQAIGLSPDVAAEVGVIKDDSSFKS